MEVPSEEERIVFLYSAPTGGHKECAEALRRGFKTFGPAPVETFGLDAVTHLYPLLGPVISRAYLEILKYTPQLWNFLYDNPDIEEITREFRQFMGTFNRSKLNKILAQYRPTAFVCTHALPCTLIAQEKKNGKCDLPLVGVVTDYAVHSYWVHPQVDLYIVANAASADTLEARGIPRERIRICGIPVDPQYRHKLRPQEARRRLGLDLHRPVVLVMGGAHGLGPIAKIVPELLALKNSPQIVVVAGVNKELQKDLSPHQKTKSVHLFGFTRLIPLLMDAADLLVTKPGGITTSEALAKGLPMILVKPIPGQEERNARFLVRNGAAVQVKKIEELRDAVRLLVGRRERLELLSQRALRIARPHAVEDACREISALLKSRRGVPPAEEETEPSPRAAQGLL